MTATSTRLVYVDSSLVVAMLAPDDPNHHAARKWASRTTSPLISSAVAEVEVGRALNRRQAPDFLHQAARRLLARVHLVEITASIRAAAVLVRPASVRSLDALHVATALSAGVAHFASLDMRQRLAAEEMGLDLLKLG